MTTLKKHRQIAQQAARAAEADRAAKKRMAEAARKRELAEVERISARDPASDPAQVAAKFKYKPLSQGHVVMNPGKGE